MAAKVTIKKRTKAYNAYMNVVDIQMDSSYPTGGEAITPQQLGLNVIDFVLASPAAGYIAEFDHANSKLKMYTPTAAHVHNENTAASYTQNADTDENTASAADEVANTTDLSAVTVRVVAMGI